LEVSDNRVTVLADAAEQDDAIDLERAEAALERAQKLIASSTADVDLEKATASLQRARVRVKLGRRRRERGLG
jgi:F-type H+-transporting ATPase subunit epsilon